MAVLIEAISVVVRAEAVLAKLPGGWDAFKSSVPNETLCADGEIARAGFMGPQDVEIFVRKLQTAGLEFLRDGEAVDIAVADQMRGLTSICKWLEFGHISLDGKGSRVAACRMVGSRVKQIVTPPEWKFEGSLSSTFSFVPGEHIERGMKFLRHENGLDVYLNPITGKEMYYARPFPQDAESAPDLKSAVDWS